ncbi:MAG: GGDEF domain-containing protein, partial [Solirubrobacteraceae bacterium]|nr:GGDEF domain-containing protein [Solirubrobacteraceae bacterium]
RFGLHRITAGIDEVFAATNPDDQDAPRLAERLCRLPNVRIAVGLLFFGLGLLALVAPAMFFPDRTAALIATGLIPITTGALIQLVPTDRIDVRWLHALPAIVTIELIVAVAALGTDATAIMPAFALAGAASAFVVESRQDIALHLVATITALVVAAAVIGTTTVALATVGGIILMCWTAALTEMSWRSADEQADELGRLMRRDPLTDVGNRRLLSERLAHELPLHARTGEPLTVLVLDLNGFKQINDELGHAAGDALLRAVADVLTGSVRHRDTVVRHGGDEFCVLAPETGAGHAAALAAKVRAALASVEVNGGPLGCAIGVATFPQDGPDAGRLLEAADDRQRADKPDAALRVGPV